MKVHRHFVWAIAISFIAGLRVCAQSDSLWPESAVVDDPRLGLVLSGGGAKALAHIGLLKVMEEEGLRPDRIAGTSMGSVIGALFAIGYSASQIEEELRSIDWVRVLTNDQTSEYLPLIDKGAEERYLLSFPIVKGRLQLPDGINYGQNILVHLSRLCIPTHGISDFSKFPIPFSCLATDLETGEGVVLDTGRLSDALRASTSFPTLYSPYRLGNRLLIDGGLVSNFPSGLLADSVDIIIGSDVQDEAYTGEALHSMIRVLEQISSFVNAENYRRDTARAAILVRPMVPGVGITTFDLFDSIVSAGYHAADRHRLEIRELARRKKPKLWTTLPIPPPNRKWPIASVELETGKPLPEIYGRQKLGLQVPDSLNIRDIEHSIDRLYARGLYRTVDYRIAPTDSSGYRLFVRPGERNPRSLLRFGLHYDLDFQTALLVNYTHREWLFDSDRLKFDVAVGTLPRMWIDYRLDRQYIPSVGFKIRSHRMAPSLYAGGKSFLQLDYWDFSASVFFQTLVANRLSFEGGAQYENIWIDDPLDAFLEAGYEKSYINYYGEIKIDYLDRVTFPRRGFQFKADFRMFTQTNDYTEMFEPGSIMDIRFFQALRFGSRWFAHLNAELATTIGPDLDYPYNLFLGGLGQNYIQYVRPFAGYQFMELFGRNSATVAIDLHWEFAADHLLIGKANVGKLENSLQSLESSDVLLDGYALSYAYLSPVGPLQLSVHGSTNHPWVYTYVNLGFWF